MADQEPWSQSDISPIPTAIDPLITLPTYNIETVLIQFIKCWAKNRLFDVNRHIPQLKQYSPSKEMKEELLRMNRRFTEIKGPMRTMLKNHKDWRVQAAGTDADESLKRFDASFRGQEEGFRRDLQALIDKLNSWLSAQKTIKKKAQKQIAKYREATDNEKAEAAPFSQEFGRLQVRLDYYKEMYKKMTEMGLDQGVEEQTLSDGLDSHWADRVRRGSVCGGCFDPVDQGCRCYKG